MNKILLSNLQTLSQESNSQINQILGKRKRSLIEAAITFPQNTKKPKQETHQVSKNDRIPNTKKGKQINLELVCDLIIENNQNIKQTIETLITLSSVCVSFRRVIKGRTGLWLKRIEEGYLYCKNITEVLPKEINYCIDQEDYFLLTTFVLSQCQEWLCVHCNAIVPLLNFNRETEETQCHACACKYTSQIVNKTNALREYCLSAKTLQKIKENEEKRTGKQLKKYKRAVLYATALEEFGGIEGLREKRLSRDLLYKKYKNNKGHEGRERSILNRLKKSGLELYKDDALVRTYIRKGKSFSGLGHTLAMLKRKVELLNTLKLLGIETNEFPKEVRVFVEKGGDLERSVMIIKEDLWFRKWIKNEPASPTGIRKWLSEQFGDCEPEEICSKVEEVLSRVHPLPSVRYEDTIRKESESIREEWIQEWRTQDENIMKEFFRKGVPLLCLLCSWNEVQDFMQMQQICFPVLSKYTVREPKFFNRMRDEVRKEILERESKACVDFFEEHKGSLNPRDSFTSFVSNIGNVEIPSTFLVDKQKVFKKWMHDYLLPCKHKEVLRLQKWFRSNAMYFYDRVTKCIDYEKGLERMREENKKIEEPCYISVQSTKRMCEDVVRPLMSLGVKEEMKKVFVWFSEYRKYFANDLDEGVELVKLNAGKILRIRFCSANDLRMVYKDWRAQELKREMRDFDSMEF